MITNYFEVNFERCIGCAIRLLSTAPGFETDSELFQHTEATRWPSLREWAESEPYYRPHEPKIDAFGDVEEPRGGATCSQSCTISN